MNIITKLGPDIFLRPQRPVTKIVRTIVSESPFKHDGNWLTKIKYRVGLGDSNIFALRRATIFQYEACSDKLNPELYFKHFQLPDTMFSFFLLVQLHVWMCQARSMKEGKEGRILRNEILERMWQDMDTRMSKLDDIVLTKRKKILKDLLYHQQGAMISYDEGLLSDDKTLASSVWRTLYSKQDVDPQVLEKVVKYIRIQIDHIRSIGPRDWCINGRFDWAPFPPLVVPKVSNEAKAT